MTLGLLLAVYPLPSHYAWFRPEFIALLSIFFALYHPYRFGVLSAWAIGLIQDIAVGGVWGAHALAQAFVVYVCLCSYQRLQSYGVVQQTLWVFVLVGLHQMGVNWVQGLDGYIAPAQMIVLPALVTALCWPLLAVLLKPKGHFWHH